MNILLVEPQATLARIYSRALTRAGHKVYWQKNAQSAIHAADKNLPDLVILELNLGEHNGVEFLFEFRSYPDWQDIPIIIHSFVPGSDMSVEGVTWQQLNIAGYLYKPATTLHELLVRVETIEQQYARLH